MANEWLLYGFLAIHISIGISIIIATVLYNLKRFIEKKIELTEKRILHCQEKQNLIKLKMFQKKGSFSEVKE